MENFKLETAPRDKRVPTQNQAKACYMCARACSRLPAFAPAACGGLAMCGPKQECTLIALSVSRYYNSYHQCKYDFSEEEPQCAKLKQWAASMCPEAWVRQSRCPHVGLVNLPAPMVGSLYCHWLAEKVVLRGVEQSRPRNLTADTPADVF